jgi:hypothetical protein
MLREMGEDNGNSSMIINDNEGSMIINNSTVIVEEKEKPTAFLNKYISGLKNSEN